jgi:hypothetical protein
MAKLILVILLSLFLLPAGSQSAFSAKELTMQQIPKSIKFKGSLFECWTWKDKLGENIFIMSYFQPEINTNREEDGHTEELHAFHFVKKDSVYKLLWKISDSEKDCDFDLTLEFLDGAALITDLDKDGIAETTIQYKLSCRSDVSPANMKLIMHEDSVKYALRGLMWVKSGEDSKFTVTEKDVNLETLKGYKRTGDEWEKTTGRYQTEKEFAKAPPEFLIFARRQWMKYVKEKFE